MAVHKRILLPKVVVEATSVGVESGGFAAAFAPQELVDKNRAELTKNAVATTALKVDTGAEVAHVTPADVYVEADAAITRTPGHALLMAVADCSPVVLFSYRTPVLALMHCGRQNLDADIIARTVAVLVKDDGVVPQDVGAYVGPGIREASYRLEPSYSAYFTHKDWAPFLRHHPDGSFNVDMAGFINDQLQKSGIAADRITIEPIDTAIDRNYYSHYAANRHGLPEGRNGFAVTMQPRRDV